VDDLTQILRDHLARGVHGILVTVARETGSAPREAGAAMLVTPEACFGTVGGGRLELQAIERARAMLADGEDEAMLDLPLGPALGQCCGGHVLLTLSRAGQATVAQLETVAAQEIARRPSVFLFGAGHVGQALTRALLPLPLALTVIDDRAQFLTRLPDGADARLSAAPVSEVASAPAGAAFVVMTHSHGLDYELTGAALDRGDAAYVGLIGSRTKRARFERWYRVHGADAAALAGLTCPIGGDAPRDKRPSVIAALAAAEIVSQALADGAAAATATIKSVGGGTSR